jgi:hypothetical protein
MIYLITAYFTYQVIGGCEPTDYMNLELRFVQRVRRLDDKMTIINTITTFIAIIITVIIAIPILLPNR